MHLHRGTPELLGAGMLLQRASRATPHVKAGFCHNHRGATLISFVFTVVLTVFGLCNVLEFCSDMCFHVVIVVCCSSMFMFYVVVVDLVVAE